MNNMWSNLVQDIGTLYSSRMLRFDDRFRETYLRAFQIDGRRRILEIGCGPGALTQSLARWYPEAEVIGLDRDSAFVAYAAQQAPELTFLEGDATALPFADGAFDVVISNTVVEHIEPSAFFGEQLRVLKPGGVCLVLSARRGIHIAAPCTAEETPLEQEIWKKAEEAYRKTMADCAVGAYAMSERELPETMERYGFRAVSTDYLTINLTPDNPDVPSEMARAMIEAARQNDLDGAELLLRIAPETVTLEEIAELKRLVHQRYNQRLAQYEAGEKQWDTSMSLTMVLRGVK